MTRADALAFLATLAVGDAVELERDGRTLTVHVQRNLRGGGDPVLSRSDGAFGSDESIGCSVGYGPGRWNTRVDVAGMVAGFHVIRRAAERVCDHKTTVDNEADNGWTERCLDCGTRGI